MQPATLCITEVSMRVPCLQVLDPICLSPPDLTQKPERHIPEILAAGGRMSLACAFRSTCKETKALFLSWKRPNMSSNTDGSSNSSSSVLHFTLKPKDHDTTLGCHLNFSPANLTGSSMVCLQEACECWWARENPESVRNGGPKRKT